jgi:hypothetical protein
MFPSRLVSYGVYDDHISISACKHIIDHISINENDTEYVNKLLIEKTSMIVDKIRKDSRNDGCGFYLLFNTYKLITIIEKKNMTTIFYLVAYGSSHTIDNSSEQMYVSTTRKSSSPQLIIPIVNVIWFLSGNGNLAESGGLCMHDGSIIPAKASSVVCCIRGWCFPVSIITPTEADMAPLLFVIIPLFHVI